MNSIIPRIYYPLKPFIPRQWQIFIRRQIALRRRPRYSHVWPIDEKAGKAPEGWNGWPDGKNFSVVLTHDVESPKGVSRCLQLAKIEQDKGFRSSFNFVAEQYRIPPALREELEKRGFEIGLHGIRHHGNLFQSRKIFKKNAAKINQYLKQWNVVGFRSPSNYHNLDWIRDLNIEYDLSTFDTDPFEPQPDGAGTIFPFFPEKKKSARAVVELPSTLPQDFTLFVILQMGGIDVWKRKIDWIAEKGGIALLNTHPDYMGFNGNHFTADEYPPKYYVDFLNYIQEKYQNQFWQPLPRDLARFWIRNRAKEEPHFARRLRVCMLSYSFYESDNRVRRYAESLAKRGNDVDVIALYKRGQKKFEIIKGVNIHRIQERMRDERGKLDYLLRLLKFFIRSSLMIGEMHLQRPYDLVHVHSIPDFEVFAAWFPKMTGAKIILDIHDIVPELYISKFHKGNNSLLFKALVWIEKLSAAFSDHVIISNDLWKEKIVKRSVRPGKCTAILNYPDDSIFYPKPRKGDENRPVVIYPGTLNFHQGLDIAIRAFHLIRDKIPGAEFHIYGSGNEEGNLKRLVRDLGLVKRVLFKSPLALDEIAQVMAHADLGVVPKRNGFFGGEAFSTKILEFMSLGVPVIVSATKIDSYYFNDAIVRFSKPEDEKELGEKMLLLLQNPRLREEMSRRASEFVRDFAWSRKENEYFSIVDSLVKK